MEIFLLRDGQQFGPYTAEWLESFVEQGAASAKDLAWTAGREGWVPLRVLLAELRPAPDTETLAEQPGERSVEPRPEPVLETHVQPETVPSRRDETAQLGLRPDIAQAVHGRPGLQARISLRGVAAVAAGIALIVLLLLLMNVPKHASIARNGSHWLLPDDGYSFVDANDPFSWEVEWTPGKPSTVQASMLAGATPGTWQLAPGYERPNGDAIGKDPVWTPSKREPAYPHVAAGNEPGTWVPDPGYEFTGSPIAPDVTWRAGVRLPHMVSAERERSWIIDDGYDLAKDATSENPSAVWSPGARHSMYRHAYASPIEGQWYADEGYQWIAPNDLRTFNPGRTAEVWLGAAYIDAATSGIDCSSNRALLAVIETARDRYNALDMSEVHPQLAKHLASVHTTLKNGATTVNTCSVVENAGDGVDLAAAALCLFSDNWQRCMQDSATVRKVIRFGGELGTLTCEQAGSNFRTSLNELHTERWSLQGDFQNQYGLQLAQPSPLVTCR